MVVVEIDRTTPALGVSISDVELLDKTGAVVAAMKRLDRVNDIAAAGTPPALSAPGSWGYFMTTSGTPFSGVLAPGTTRLQARVALDRDPREPERFRVTISGLGGPVVVSGPISGAWATG